MSSSGPEVETPDANALDESASWASDGKAPRTARGARTLRKILDAALHEFGERGFADSSIVGITTRAEVALGTFYTYFDSKEAVFRALVRDMSLQVRDSVAPSLDGATDALDAERRALAAFLRFVRGHKQVYRIIDEAEFVDPEGFRSHYESTAERIRGRLSAATGRGELRPVAPLGEEVTAWAIMGANVFLGLRFGVWGDEDEEAVAEATNRLLRGGLTA
ncbi:MAG: Transcriptional regulator, AcrR family [uncultured Sphingomonas sp.]|uniref:Transcriptional regulator, AcrR family n=1 Tax=uncultured Sphingomonas sp. TaxID=158754 RepID=A0A6J4SL29_9SPHN|nr:TetR/AcrR family transcriptional regulator [uncultured Sphingomonas sp.]CAA9494555.1 MAG: Transcriptional regulator, AcrR family [uncultured Sphingomonas sp.]